jgi:biopolymer transport protein ExbD
MRTSTTSLCERRPSALAGVADLDVTPVMNMFIILIPFLISMTAFTHLAVHDFRLPGDESADHATERADLPLTVAVSVSGLLLAQGDVVIGQWSRHGAEQDLVGLAERLRDQTPGPLVLAVDGPVLTAEVVACLDACRASGFTDVALAAGTDASLSGEADQ